MNNYKAINPYIIGRPIHEIGKMFGREDLFEFIEENLKKNIKFFLLHGQRRIGKSSVLQQISHRVIQDGFVFVIFDLQGYSKYHLSDILYNLSQAIIDTLNLNRNIITLPDYKELAKDKDIFSDFLRQVFQELGNKNLVLLLDEFDAIDNDNNILNSGDCFFKYLQSVLNKYNQLFIIPVAGRFKDDLQHLLDLFNSPPSHEVGLLDAANSKKLITTLAQGRLEYEEDAIKAILELSSGHPYFTQAICFNLFAEARNQQQEITNKIKNHQITNQITNQTTNKKTWIVTHADVENIVEQTIETSTAGLVWFWDGLDIYEQVIFSAVAETQKIAIEQNKSSPDDPLRLLEEIGVIQTEQLTQAVKTLIKNKFLDDTGCRIKIELVRHWLIRNHPVRKTIWELEKFREDDIQKFSKEAVNLAQEGKNQDAINCYEEILKINPNHFSTLPVLAERYLEIENFDKALELYQRSEKVDPVRNQEALLLVREKYGENLRKKREYTKAKSQLKKVLVTEPERELTKYKLQEIEYEIELQDIEAELSQQQQWKSPSKIAAIKPTRQLLILGTIVVGIIVLIGGIGVYRILPPCPQGEQKVNGICHPESSKISRGDRTLFFNIRKPSRDKGIEAFKKGNYSQAVELFRQAVKNNHNDPEVWIYYNNARAHQEGNPVTLAAVVPVDNAQPRAQEMLRGVAQAQNEFNRNGGFNGRLLEIVIANDGNNPHQSEKIAEKLVKDESILGVIGHNSSNATEAALDVYEKANIAIVSPTSSAKSLSSGSDVFFRTVSSSAVFGKKLAEYAHNSKLNKVVIFYNPNSSPYSKSLRKEFKTNFEGFQGEIISEVDFTNPKINIEQVLKDSKDKQVQAAVLFPDVKYNLIAPEIAKINKNNNLNLKLLGANSLYTHKTLEDGGKSIEGLVIVVPWFKEASQSKRFAQSAEKYWGGDVSWRTATSFDATQAFIQAFSLNPSRKTILERLKNINLSSKETSGNEIKFTEDGEVETKPVLVKVEEGKFKLLETP